MCKCFVKKLRFVYYFCFRMVLFLLNLVKYYQFVNKRNVHHLCKLGQRKDYDRL